MQKIVDGVRYDTEGDGVERVSKYTNMYDRRDLNWYKEELYRTGKGNWFLCGEGNANSKYREPVGTREWSGGEEIKPLTDEEAYQWLEDHDKVKAIKEFFEDRIEDA